MAHAPGLFGRLCLLVPVAGGVVAVASGAVAAASGAVAVAVAVASSFADAIGPTCCLNYCVCSSACTCS